MSFNQTTGVYTPAAGALTAAPGQVVQSAVWDGIFTDLTSALTQIQVQLQNTYGQRNIVGANGGFEVWQRGAGASASFAISANSISYTADRWYLSTNANQAMTVAAVAGIVNGSRLAAKITRNSGQTGVGVPIFGFPLDTDECAMLQGQNVALSFTAKAGANWSASGGTISVTFATGTGTPVKFTSGYTNAFNPINGPTATLTTSATRFVFVSTGIVPTTTAQAEVILSWTPTGTAGADDSFTIDNLQLEIIPSTTSPIAQFENWPFERMLAACKRHYRKTFPYSVAPATAAGAPGAATLVAAAVTASGFWWQYGSVSMRTTAAITTFNPVSTSAGAQDLTQSASLTVSLDAAGMNSPEGIMIYVSASGGTITVAAKDILAIHIQADAGI